MAASKNRNRTALLKLLESDALVSGAGLAKILKVSRQALHKQIQSLRGMGYLIDGKPNVGYRLLSKPEMLNRDGVLSQLDTKKFGRKIYCEGEIGSTQDWAKGLAEKGETEGTLVIAEKQTAGRGRLGRSWTSNSGGIWASLILRPKILPQDVPAVAQVAALAILEAIEETCGVRCDLKWPNDLLIQHPASGFRKVCGLLTEMSAESERVHWVALGLGINVNNPIPSSLKNIAANLKEAAGTELDRARLLARILKKLEGYYERFVREGFRNFRADVMEHSILKGKEVAVEDGQGRTSGKFFEIGEDGSLVLLSATGEKIRFLAGDVSLGSYRRPSRRIV